MKKLSGFTLIELLVVIVIIGILSGIGISQFKSYQTKTRDTKRIHQFVQTANLLKQYTVINQSLPPAISGPITSCAGWRFFNQSHTNQIFNLEGYTLSEDYFENCIGFSYYRYSAGTSGCPTEKGDFLVFGVNLEQINNNTKSLEDFGLTNYSFHCSGRTWGRANDYFRGGPILGIFENGDFGPQ